MGISGLTTFIQNDSRLYLENYKLHDINVVIDGNSIAFMLYLRHSRCNDCFGGDYDKYAAVVKTFFQLLNQANVTPYVILDGAYEEKKMDTILARFRDRIKAAKNLNVDKGHIFPLFLCQTFYAVMKEMNVKQVTCDFECDTEVACLAKDLNCPLMSFDSDFYIFDALYIPFTSIRLKLRKHESCNYIECKVYRIDRFLHLNDLDKNCLPILAVLLGNDYIKKTVFSEDTKDCPTQERIESAIKWLQNESRDSAINKIRSKYDSTNQQLIAKQIYDAIKGYDLSNSSFIEYFNLTVEIQDRRPQNTNLIPVEFMTKYRNCEFPPSFMNLMVLHKYFYLPTAEDHTLEPAHKISFKIMAAIHKILTSLTKLTCIARFGENDIKNYEIECDWELPKFEEIPSIPQDLRRDYLLNILGIDTCFVDQCLKNFPPSWHILLIALKYVSLKDHYVYSIVLCAIILGHNQKQNNVYKLTGTETKITDQSELCNCFDVIRKYDLVLCKDKLLHLFFVNPDLMENNELYQRQTVHNFAEYQSALIHIVYLNVLFEYPFQVLHVHNCYNGTFLYNIANNLKNCEDLDDYVKTLIGDCPTVLNCFKMTIYNLRKTILNK